MPNRSMCSGLTVQRMTEKVGRALSSAAPPATASAMRISGRASDASLMLTTMLCLREARMQASNSCRTRLSSGRVLRGHEGRGGGEVVEALDDARGVVDVLLDALAHGAVGLAHPGGAAVGGQVGVLAVDGEVELGLAAAEREGARQGRERLFDGARRDARDGRLAVHDRAVGLEHVERPVRVEHGAGLGEHVEGGLVDALHLGRAEDLQRPPPPDVASVGVRGHEAPFGMSLSVVARRPSPCVNSTATYGEVTARTSAS